MKKYLVILMVLAVCLSGIVMAGSLPEDVENILLGSTYLDLRSDNPADSPPGPDTRNGLTLATSGDSWGYPDSSDSFVTVYNKGLDSSGHTASDFSGTISGLTSGQSYEVYVLAAGRSVSLGYDLEWGASSTLLNLVSPVSQAPDGVVVYQTVDNRGDPVELYAIPMGTYEADASGVLVFWFGDGDHGDRTVFDGIAIGEDINICYLRDDSDIITSGTTLDITLEAGIEAPESITWTQTSGPATVTPTEGGDVRSWSADYTVTGDYVYTVEAQWASGTISKTATYKVYVVDSANNAMVAHWDFDGLPDPNDLIDQANDYDGIFGGGGLDREPNTVTGHMSPKACEFYGDSYWTIDDPYASQPNFADLGYGLTMAAWLKVDVTGPGRVLVIDGILEYGVRDDGTAWFYMDGTNYYTNFQIADGNWHFFAVTADPLNGVLKYYLDGEIVQTWDIEKTKLFDLTDEAVLIGNRADLARYYTGFCDDLKVYNYPKTEAELIALSMEGDLPPIITAGADREIIYNGTSVALEGVVLYDEGLPDFAELIWTVAGVPSGVDPAKVEIDDASVADTTVTFLAPVTFGTYTFLLTADDGENEPVSDEVQITIVEPSCQELIAAGYKQTGDISGENGEPDCRVDFHDFLALAEDWLECIDPADVNCTSPF